MKIMPWITLGLCLFPSLLNAQQRIIITQEYTEKIRDFTVPLPGDTAIFLTGGIALVDTLLLNTTLAMAQLIDTANLEEATQLALRENERKIVECERLYADLLNNCQREHDLHALSLARNQRSVEELNASLQNTRQALLNANASLEQARKQVKRSRLPRLWHGLLIGAAGFGLGAIVVN
ncbi:MAG: hypothetical protein IH599_10180 [Bacteroidales bacterium]|nr:hypothetical protein [Bacteroidales bacterium]